MRKKILFLIFLLLIPIFLYTRTNHISGPFKVSNFLKKYHFNSYTQPAYYENGMGDGAERNPIDVFVFEHEKLLGGVWITCDHKSQRILKQLLYIGPPKEEMNINALITDFIAEAVGRKVNDKATINFVNKFIVGFKKEGKVDKSGVFCDQTKNAKFGNSYATIEKNLDAGYVITVEPEKEFKAKKRTIKESGQKLVRKDVASLILKGLEEEMWAGSIQYDPSSPNAIDEQYENAISNYLKAIQLAPTNLDVNLLLARDYIFVDKCTNSIEILEKYLNTSPKDKYALFYLGKSYYLLKNYEKAEKVLKSGIECCQEYKSNSEHAYPYYRWEEYGADGHPNVPLALHHFLGKTLKELKKFDEAIVHYQEITSKMPLQDISNPYVIIYVELGEIYWLNGKKEKANEILNQLRSNRPFGADELKALMKD